MPPRPRSGGHRPPRPNSAKTGQRDWTMCFTITAFGVIGLFMLLMTLVDDPDMITVEGWPTVIDGDTLQIGREKLRLVAIDAPELDQVCLDDDGYVYACGEVAQKALKRYIGWSSVTCTGYERDRYGRLLAYCSRLGWLNTAIDIGNWLILNGHAVVYAKRGITVPVKEAPPLLVLDYIDSQTTANRKGRGIWVGDFDDPWTWRKNGSDCQFCTQEPVCCED